MSTGTVLAQEKTFRLVVIDSAEGTPIEKCTISIQTKDGKKTKSLTDEQGRFTIHPKTDSTTLTFHHTAYKEESRLVAFAQLKMTDTIRLSPLERQLEEIVVKAKVPPVVIKGDTTEFNVDSSMFEPFDVVEDLVKRLPGLGIDADGRMSFHGKPITRILVDGEDLFGGDPDFSLKKLPAGMVAKIQVMDTKTLEQVFNNVQPDGEDKTLNIKLKEGNKTFGTADATAGTKNQLEGNAMVSMFEKARKLSASASANSSNKIGISKIASGPSTSSANGGISYSNKWGNVRVNSGYSYNENSNNNRIYRERTQIITADTSFFTRNSIQSDYKSFGHRLNLSANWFIDSSSTLDISLSYNISRNIGQNNSWLLTQENGSLRNESTNNTSSKGNNQSTTATLSWLKRFSKKGRTLTVNAKTNQSHQQTNLFTKSFNTYFKTGLSVDGDTLDRQTKTVNASDNYNVSLNFMEPITKSLRLNLRGDFDFNRTSTNREIFNLDSISHRSEFDSLYSAKIFSTANTQNLGASLVFSDKKWNVSSGLNTVRLQAARNLQNQFIGQELFRYSPSVNASYILSKGKTVRLNFSAVTMQPTIEQLQPVPDNSNPLYIRLGNPDLRTAFSQTYGLAYNYNDTSGSMNAGISYAPVNNQIVNAVYFDEFRRQTSRFINVDGVYSLRGNWYLFKTRRNGKRSQSWTMSSGINYGQQVYFQNNQQYYTHTYSANGEFSFASRASAVRSVAYSIGMNSSFGRNWIPLDKKLLNTTRLSIGPKLETSLSFLKEAIYFTNSYQVNYSKLDYHSTLRKNDEYSTHNINSNLNAWIKKKYAIQASLHYQYNSRVPEGTNKGILTCNFSTSAQVLKGKAQIVLSAFDLFSMNTNFRRVIGDNFIEDVQTNNLQNYFILKFRYSFSILDKR